MLVFDTEMLISQQQGEEKNRDANQSFPVFHPFSEAKYGTVSQAQIRAQVGTASRFSISWTKQRTFKRRYLRKTIPISRFSLNQVKEEKELNCVFSHFSSEFG